ncbi:DUF4153 domain-containing protein [Aminipila luticellarii]|uniref:DUF4173 domain-containing protein n=1 Tax=Aminipila luticellarii TaxID=2507160 RepID=A0A410PTG2_9FIRM|nr:DUF4173 domain-containing protein [Aminipila luticellarii]QAT42199.1 DUF4173 domain-containing protein [Aminipila luticellarii]
MKYYFTKSGEVNPNGHEKSYDIKGIGMKPMKFELADFWFAAALLFCGFLYWNFIWTTDMGAGVTAFSFILCGAVYLYFKAKGVTQSRKSMVWLALTAVSSVQFLLFDGYTVKCLNLLFTSACFIYWIAVSTGRCLDIKLSGYTLWDLLNQTFIVPFSNIACEFFGLKQGLSKSRYGRNVVYIAAGAIVFLPLMVFVTEQLSLADAAFEGVLDKILQSISLNSVLTYTFQFIMGIPVACYLFGLIYGNTAGRNTDSMSREEIRRISDTVSFAPKLTVYTVMIVFNLIYLLFFVSQTAYFLSAFQNILPDTFTYAEYARRGFFELCKVSGVNAFLIFLAHAFVTKKEKSEEVYKSPKMLRFQTAFMSVMTISLIITALRKMYMYIQFYGLTQLRVYTSWFMVMLLLAFIILFIRQIKVFNAARIMIIGGILGFMVLSYGNADGNIAKYNIENYENGRLEEMDYNALFTLSDGAVPYAYDLYKKTEDAEKKQILYNYIVYGNQEGQNITHEKSFRDFNIQ